MVPAVGRRGAADGPAVLVEFDDAGVDAGRPEYGGRGPPVVAHLAHGACHHPAASGLGRRTCSCMAAACRSRQAGWQRCGWRPVACVSQRLHVAVGARGRSSRPAGPAGSRGHAPGRGPPRTAHPPGPRPQCGRPHEPGGPGHLARRPRRAPRILRDRPASLQHRAPAVLQRVGQGGGRGSSAGPRLRGSRRARTGEAAVRGCTPAAAPRYGRRSSGWWLSNLLRSRRIATSSSSIVRARGFVGVGVQPVDEVFADDFLDICVRFGIPESGSGGVFEDGMGEIYGDGHRPPGALAVGSGRPRRIHGQSVLSVIATSALFLNVVRRARSVSGGGAVRPRVRPAPGHGAVVPSPHVPGLAPGRPHGQRPTALPTASRARPSPRTPRQTGPQPSEQARTPESTSNPSTARRWWEGYWCWPQQVMYLIDTEVKVWPEGA